MQYVYLGRRKYKVEIEVEEVDDGGADI